jgi:hypothetical protein
VNSSTINLATSLAANGSSGPETLAIGTDSSAFEEVPPANCTVSTTVSTDERGEPRPGFPGENCDAGAFEAQEQTITMDVTGSTTFDQSGVYNVDASSNDPGATLVYKIDSSGNAAGCTVDSSGKVSFTGLGHCTIDVNSAAQGTYAAAQAQQVLTVGAGVQATLVVSSTGGTYGTSLLLTTRGGSGSGAVSYAVTAAGSAGCSLTGGGTTLSATNAGTCTVTATKAADADHNAASSTATAVTFGKAASTTVLKLSARKVIYGHEQTEHLSVTVSPQFPGSMPTGTVTVKASTRTLCAIRLKSAKGSCRLSARRLKARTYHLVATYRGSTNFDRSTSPKKTLTIVK